MVSKGGFTGTIPGGVKELSKLEIDTDKDWNEKRIHNVSEVSLTPKPKASSSGPEGTILFDKDDKCVYVAVEV